jgi:hypothetical protein
LAATAARSGATPSVSFMVDWAKELMASQGSDVAGPITANYDSVLRERVAAGVPGWDDLEPTKRAFDDPTLSIPEALASRLRDLAVQVIVADQLKASNAAIVVRSASGNIHMALMSAGTHVTPSKALAGESVEVWLLPDGPGSVSGEKLAEIDAARVDASGGLTIEVADTGGAASAKVSTCPDSAEICTRTALESQAPR